MANLRRTGRTIIATGGVSTPGLERLKNGDILASYRRFRPDLGNGGDFSNWVGEVLRSTDGGRTWSDPIVEVRGRRPGIPETLVPYYGMAQLPDGTILLPSMGPMRGTYMMRSTDDGITWERARAGWPGHRRGRLGCPRALRQDPHPLGRGRDLPGVRPVQGAQ